jgi:hypothetical protein
MTGFVDDTKGQTNNQTSDQPMPLQQQIFRMQADAQLWGNLLHILGGALEIPKCNYYVMQWKFKPSGTPELAKDFNTVLHLKNGDQTVIVTLTNNSITVAHKTLGQIKQAAILQDKSNKYARTSMASPITQANNWMAYHAIYLPRMTFVLPTSYSSEQRLQNIEKRAIAATLCKGGFVPTFSRHVAFGPHRYRGIAMQPLIIKQLI